MIARNRALRTCLAVAVPIAMITACAAGGGSPSTAQAGTGTGTITVWAHDGQPAENTAIQQAVTAFNDTHTGVTVKLTLLPANTYTQTITTTPRDKLPDVFEYDGPTMSSYVYAGKLSPILGLVSAATIANQTSSVVSQNTYTGNKKLYGVSIIDSGFGIYGNKALLAQAGVTPPTSWSDAWTADQFQADLAKIAAVTPQHKALDIQENDFPGELASYGFLPIVNSTGNQVVVNNTAQGNLNNPKVVAAITQLAGWARYIDANTDNNAFTAGRVALSWVGHWMYPTYGKALGNNLVVLPLPDFGDGAKSAQGSWGWGISAATRNGSAAGKFLNYLTSDRVVSAYSDGDGAPPATRTVLATSPLYRPGGPLYLFELGLQHSCGTGPLTTSCVAVPRPVTPAYPVISQQFGEVIENALKGQNAQTLLDNAATAIDQAYRDNNDYGTN